MLYVFENLLTSTTILALNFQITFLIFRIHLVCLKSQGIPVFQNNLKKKLTKKKEKEKKAQKVLCHL